MKLGYDQPLFVLPFDHRHSYGAEVFGFHDPLSPEQIAVVSESKAVIYQGFKLALAAGAKKESCGILVDEEFGASILRDARENGFITAMSVEKSGQHEFDFEYGEAFGQHIEAFDPTFAKVLVRFNPEGDASDNQMQLERLKRLSDYLRDHDRLLMFELLVPAEKAQLAAMGSQAAYDEQLRPRLMVQAIGAIQDFGIEPDVWKIEGLDRRGDCEKIVAVARRNGRSQVGCIVLGRGEQEHKVVEWLQIAATVPGFIGFAVGRSSFLQAIVDLRAGRTDKATASKRISDKFLEWIGVWEGAGK